MVIRKENETTTPTVREGDDEYYQNAKYLISFNKQSRVSFPNNENEEEAGHIDHSMPGRAAPEKDAGCQLVFFQDIVTEYSSQQYGQPAGNHGGFFHSVF